MCAYAQDAHMQYPQTETPNFACGCWFSVSCLMPFKTLAQLLLQCSVIQGLKMKLKIPQTTGKKRTKTIPTFQSHQVEKVHVNRNTKAMCFFSYIHMLFFFFFLLFISLRSNQNWSEQYGTLRTNSAVNRAFGRMQLRIKEGGKYRGHTIPRYQRNPTHAHFEGTSDPCELHRPCVGRTSLNEALSIYPHNIVLISHCCLCNKSKFQICTHTIFSLLEPQMK